jgi:uncharacterized membrane protein YhhN
MIFVLLGALSLCGLLYAEWQGSLPLRWIFKPLTSLLFVLTGIWMAFGSGGGNAQGYTPWILFGLILGALGDVLLIPKDRKVWFLAGVAAFFLGHITYVIAFTHLNSPLDLDIPLIAAVVIVGMMMFFGLRPYLGDMLPVVAAYIIVISLMVIAALAVALEIDTPEDFRALLGAGALCFYLSDIAVALDRFVKPKHSNAFWGLPLYYAGQFMLALTLRALAHDLPIG